MGSPLMFVSTYVFVWFIIIIIIIIIIQYKL